MEYKITLTQEDLQILSVALGEIPYKLAAPLVAKINKQLEVKEDTVVEVKE